MAAVNLFDLFGSTIFRIPDYQRGYAWEEKQLIEFWDDLEDIQIEGSRYKNHYTGTIYLEEIQPEESERWLSGVRFCAVVDGQQRLTTISIFLFELLKLESEGYCGESREDLFKRFLFKPNLSGNSTVYKFSYAHADKNYKFLLKRIFEVDSIILDNHDLNLYTKNLLEAKQFFKTRLELLDHTQREIIFQKLTSSFQFDIRTIEKDLDVQAVFETMNNRGKPLSILEKLKNRLIYLNEKIQQASEDKATLRRKINDAWGQIYFWLAQNPTRILSEDEFLSAHLSLYRKPREAVFSEKIAEEKVFQMFCNKSEKFDRDESGLKEDSVSYDKIEKYIIALSTASKIWFEIHNSPLLVVKKILLMNSGKELKVFLLASLLTDDKTKLNPFLENIEKILFKNRIMGMFDERTTASWARDIYSKEDNIDGVNTKMLHYVTLTIAVHTLIQNMNSLYDYERGAKGFYRWGVLKYFVFEYENYLKHKSKETNDKISIDDFDTTTIEHIIPQQYSENWNNVVTSFEVGIISDDTELIRKVLLNTLGNLTILKNGKNSSLGHRGWLEKKERFRTGSYNEIDISRHQNWTDNEIFTRGVDMLDFLESKVIGLKLTRTEKCKLLYYKDFITDLYPEPLVMA